MSESDIEKIKIANQYGNKLVDYKEVGEPFYSSDYGETESVPYTDLYFKAKFIKKNAEFCKAFNEGAVCSLNLNSNDGTVTDDLEYYGFMCIGGNRIPLPLFYKVMGLKSPLQQMIEKRVEKERLDIANGEFVEYGLEEFEVSVDEYQQWLKSELGEQYSESPSPEYSVTLDAEDKNYISLFIQKYLR